jgi:hypothetical protein
MIGLRIFKLWIILKIWVAAQCSLDVINEIFSNFIWSTNQLLDLLRKPGQLVHDFRYCIVACTLSGLIPNYAGHTLGTLRLQSFDV